MGKDYLVKGAKLMCVNGKGIVELDIPQEHGYDEKGRAKANCTDCKEKDNIPYFEACRKNEETHLCKGYMELAEKWENMSTGPARAEKIDKEEAITMDSVLVCNKGGLILPVTSGQEERMMLEGAMFGLRYLKSIGWARGKGLGCQIFGWDPINMNTGNFLYEKEDLVIPGMSRLSFKVSYNSMDETRGSMGEGWHHNHETRLRREKAGMLTLCRGDGKEIPYRPLAGGLYAPVMGDKGLLAESSEGWRYVDGEGEEHIFSPEGRLLVHKDKKGSKRTYSYNEKGQVTSVEGAGGIRLLFRYNKENNLISVKDHTDREVRLWYRYGKLWKFVNALGYEYTYGYNENGKLESVLTSRGITGVKNEYDAKGRVLKQSLPDGSTVELRYDDANMRTYLKEPDGNLVFYECDEKSRNTRTVYQDGEETYQYNDRNQKTLYVDKNGNATRYRYDGEGNLTGITNALKEQAEFTYDKKGRMLTAAVDGKKRVINTYDEKGRLVETTDAAGRSRKTDYDEKGLPVCLTQPDGSRFWITRDERGNIEKITDPYGGETSYAYDGLNRVAATTDAEGNTTSYRYDAGNRLLKVTNPEGNTRSYTYNESGKPVQMEDFDGGTLSITYNSMGKPEKLTDKEGRGVKRSYNEMGKLSEEISAGGAATRFTYDKNSRLARAEIRKGAKEEEAASVVSYAYDPAGNLLKTQAGNGKEVLSETSYVYDALNRVTQVIDPAGGKTVYTYDRTGHVASITDPAGNRRSFAYNDAGELAEETDIRGNTIRYEYNLLGQFSSITDGMGRKTRHCYLPGGRLEKTVYPDGREMRYVYDKLGRVVRKTDGQGYTLNYTYDCMGRVLSTASSAGQKKTYTYDAAGNVTSMKDANGNTTVYEYTLSGRLKAVTDTLGNRAEYAYDKEDRLIYICQMGTEGEENRETFYERDPLGQVECIRDALGSEEHFRYDALGRTILKTDRDGYRTEYKYTPDGKVKHIAYGDGTGVEMEYTALRQLCAVKDWLGETRIERDEAGAPTEITDHKGRTVSYEWGSMGERRSITYPDGRKALYEYDGLLRLQKMQIQRDGEEGGSLSGISSFGRTAGRPEEINYKYDEMGRLSEKLLPEGMRTRWLYDERGQLRELVHEDRYGVLDRYQYEYDLMGNKTAITKERRGLKEESGRYEYGYDSLSRLASVSKDGDAVRAYAYDSFGNRSSLEDFGRGRNTSYHYDALNRLMYKEEGGARTDYGYDKRGNLVREETEGRLLHGYEYGAMNRLSKSWNDKGGESLYLYNGLGQRMGRSINGREEDYLLDLTKPYHNLMEIYKGEECSQRFYLDGTAAAVEEASKIRKTQGRRPFPGLHYYLQDELGSPVRVSGYGEKEDAPAGRNNYLTYGYDEFGNDPGEELEEAGIPNPYDRQGMEQPLGYTGYRYDEGSGTYFAQMREYQSKSGRFMAEDVIKGNGAELRTLNQYIYCCNSPVNYVDLDGKSPITQQEANEIIWNYFLSQLNNTINAKKAKWDVYVNSVKESWNDAVNSIQTGVSDAVDNIKDFVGTKVVEIRNKLSQNNGTFTEKISINGNALFGGYADIGVSYDWKGNVAIQWSYAVTGVNDTASVGILDAGASVGWTFTDAEDVDGLLGPSSAIGASGGYLGYAAIDLISFEDMSDMNGDVDGFQIGGGVGIGMDVHLTETYTNNIFKFNIYDVLLKILGQEGECSQ